MRYRILASLILCLSIFLSPFVGRSDLLAAYNVKVVEEENNYETIEENTFYDFTPESDGVFEVWYAGVGDYSSQVLDLTTNRPVDDYPYFFEKGHTYRLNFLYHGQNKDVTGFFKLMRPKLGCRKTTETIRAKFGDEITLSVDAFSEDGPIKYNWHSISAISDVKFNSSKSSVTFNAADTCYPYCEVENNSDSQIVYFNIEVSDLEPYFTNETIEVPDYYSNSDQYILVDYGKDLDIEIAFKSGDASKSSSPNLSRHESKTSSGK